MATDEKLANLPVLPGWVNLTEAAEILGISRQHAYRRARKTNEGLPGGFKSVHRIGSKSFYVVATEELQAELMSTYGVDQAGGDDDDLADV